MKLNELNNPRKVNAVRALKEHYGINLPLAKMSAAETTVMLRKVRGLISESKQTPGHGSRHHTSSHMKLAFMEQALTSHLYDLRQQARLRIMFEDEEVEEAQVTLAAQEMVDTVQKMIEQISDMLVKELPALVSSMSSEKGDDAANQFNTQVSQTLKTLQDALTKGKTDLENARKGGSGGAPDMGGDMGGEMPDIGGEMPDMGGEMPDMGGDEGQEPLDQEEPEMPAAGNVGRSKRA